MIVGGTTTTCSTKRACKTYLWLVPRIACVDNPVIGFTEEEDARRLHHPHDDAFVISIWISDYNTHRVLTDNGSSTDILYYPTFQQMRIGRERLIPTNAPPVGFGGTRAVTSTYHLMVKFSTEYGVAEVRSDQITAHKCYIAMLEMDDHLQAMCIKEWRMTAKPIEGIKEDVFARSHKDMPGINPFVIVHKLNVLPSFSPIHQKKRVFAQEWDRAIAEEVHKLQEARFIREVYYPD
ncbi:uncharacterized protein LOC142616089 [Castanea sativa]|uniref:uncharacterized protein LOC142616089 n=1 Tax=Castanea sativa TaxID=21020 RepID=UPI003F64BE3E